MNRYLYVQTKEIYGTAKYYPACDHSKLIAQIAGTKTLTPEVMRLCVGLGYTFEEQPRTAIMDSL